MADTLARRCTVEANGKRCEKPLKARGMCAAHWARWRQDGSPGPVEVRKIRGSDAKCDEPGCDRPHESNGRCSTHNSQVKRWGETRPIQAQRSARRITEDEMAMVADLSISRAEVAERIGVSPQCVTDWRRLIKHHIFERSDWEDREIDFILEKFDSMPTAQIAGHLERDPAQVDTEIKRLRDRGVLGVRKARFLDPWLVGNRPLLAATCYECGHLLGSEFFRKRKTHYEFKCRRCSSDAFSMRTREHPERRRMLSERLQAATVDQADNNGKEWTDADLKLLSDPDRTTLQKALDLKRTYFATSGALNRFGLTSKPDEIPSPEDSAWRIFWDMEVPEGEVSHA